MPLAQNNNAHAGRGPSDIARGLNIYEVGTLTMYHRAGRGTGRGDLRAGNSARRLGGHVDVGRSMRSGSPVRCGDDVQTLPAALNGG